MKQFIFNEKTLIPLGFVILMGGFIFSYATLASDVAQSKKEIVELRAYNSEEHTFREQVKGDLGLIKGKLGIYDK